MKHYPTIRQMQYLQVLARTRNYRKAAQDCHITQPTLSAAIKEMEAILGLSLINRSNHKKIQLTAYGLALIPQIETILSGMDRIIDQAQRLGKPLSGDLRLGIIPTMAPYLLPVFLPSLHRKFPDIHFRITEGLTASLMAQMEQGELDLLLMAFPYPLKKFESDIFMDEKFLCAAPLGTFPPKKKLTIKDLEGQSLLLLEDGHCLREHALSACERLTGPQEANPEPSLKATSLPTLIQMVSQGYGITLLPDMVIRQSPLPSGLSLHSFVAPAPTRQIGLVWRGKDPLLETIRAVSAELKIILKRSI